MGRGFQTLVGSLKSPTPAPRDAVRKGVGHHLGATCKNWGANSGRYLGFPDKLSSTLEARHAHNQKPHCGQPARF